MKRFTVPFATAGDRATVPNAAQPDGSVSYEQGYPFDYSRNPATDPDARRIERDKYNQVLYDITDAVGTMQAKGLSVWDNTTEYDVPSLVFGSNGLPYIALQASGPSTAPQDPTSAPAYWEQFASHGMVVFSAAGVSAWSVPQAMQLGIIKPKVTVVAGGGSSSRDSASAGAGGGGGGAAIKVVNLTGVPSVSVTVGAGGAAPVASGNGNPGGSSSFGAYCSATGGGGGVLAGVGRNGGDGGVGTGGDINLRGGGGGAVALGVSSAFMSGAGGNSILGGGARGRAQVAAIAGDNGANGGGGGGGVGSVTGGSGGDGVVIIEW